MKMFGFMMVLALCLKQALGGQVAGSFVLGAQWFIKSSKEGTKGEYLTKGYRAINSEGFEKVSEKIYQNYQDITNNYYVIMGMLILEGLMMIGMFLNHYSKNIKMAKRSGKHRGVNPNIV